MLCFTTSCMFRATWPLFIHRAPTPGLASINKQPLCCSLCMVSNYTQLLEKSDTRAHGKLLCVESFHFQWNLRTYSEHILSKRFCNFLSTLFLEMVSLLSIKTNSFFTNPYFQMVFHLRHTHQKNSLVGASITVWVDKEDVKHKGKQSSGVNMMETVWNTETKQQTHTQQWRREPEGYITSKQTAHVWIHLATHFVLTPLTVKRKSMIQNKR